MKILNSLIKEVKNKWSTRLLVLVLILIGCTIFASNVQLKYNYDSANNAPKNRFKGLKRVFDAPFKHIKIENSLDQEIIFDTTKLQQGIFIGENDTDLAEWAKGIFVKNDTLFLINFNQYGFSRSRPIQILTQDIESISLNKAIFFIKSLNQKALTINLLDQSVFKFNNKIEGLNFCKISMAGKSEIKTKYVGGDKKDINFNIQTVEAELNDSCIFSLGRIDIENFKLKATDGNEIELSSKTVNRLMKK